MLAGLIISAALIYIQYATSGRLLFARLLYDALWHHAGVHTWRPRPFPSLAPSMIPGRSSNWILAPRNLITPGTHVSVVNSYAATCSMGICMVDMTAPVFSLVPSEKEVEPDTWQPARQLPTSLTMAN